MLSNLDNDGKVQGQVAPGFVGSIPTLITNKKCWTVCHKSGTVLFKTENEATALNRAAFGWIVKEV